MQFFVYLTMPAGRAPARPSAPPSPERMAEIMRFHEEAMKAGTIVATGRLDAQSTYIRKTGDALAITDGPFIEGKELVPGFTIIDVPSHEAAVEWATAYRDLMGMPELRLTAIRT